MKTRIWKGASAAVLLCGMVACAEEKDDGGRVLKVPVTGVKAGCCDLAVAKEIKALPGVADVFFQKNGSEKLAVIRLKKDESIELSRLREGLATATKGMGKSMGTEYKLDTANLSVDASVVFRTAVISDEDKSRLDKALAGLNGFESSAVEPPDKESSALTLSFGAGSSGKLDEVTQILKDAKIDLDEVVFRGVAAGDKQVEEGGFTCPMCGGSFKKAGECPKCGMALVERKKDGTTEEHEGG